MRFLQMVALRHQDPQFDLWTRPSLTRALLCNGDAFIMTQNSLWIRQAATSAFLFLGSLVSPQAEGAIAPQLTLDELITYTGYAFIADVVSVEAGEIGASPLRSYELKPIRSLHGSHQKPFKLSLPGGMLKSRQEIVDISGAPGLVVGQRYLIFLTREPWVFSPFTNWWHSIFRFVTLSNKEILVNDSGRVVIDLTYKGFRVGEVVTEPLPTSDVVNEAPLQVESSLKPSKEAVQSAIEAAPSADAIIAKLLSLVKLNPEIEAKFSPRPSEDYRLPSAMR